MVATPLIEPVTEHCIPTADWNAIATLCRDAPELPRHEAAQQHFGVVPAWMAYMPERVLRDLFKMAEPWQVVRNDDPAMTRSLQIYAYIRGEGQWSCTCESGHARTTVEHSETRQRVHIEQFHECCHKRGSLELPSSPWMPAAFARHRVLDLRPHPKSALSSEQQARYIAALPDLTDRMREDKQRGWFMLGPGGAGKTTYVCAVLYEEFSRRWVGHHREKTLEGTRSNGVYRLKLKEWLDQMHAWETAPFERRAGYRQLYRSWDRLDGYVPPDYDDADRRDSGQISKPDVTVESMRRDQKKTNFSPVLWLEELDNSRSRNRGSTT